MDDKNLWQGRPVAQESHKKSLDMDAAALEFKYLMPRQQAEAKAYEKYVQNQHFDASAHHLVGMAAAKAAGDTDSAKKHWALYEAHSKAIGHDPIGEPHPEVKDRMDKGLKGLYRFNVHKGDLFAMGNKTET